MQNKKAWTLFSILLATLWSLPALPQDEAANKTEMSARDMFQKAAGRLVPARSSGPTSSGATKKGAIPPSSASTQTRPPVANQTRPTTATTKSPTGNGTADISVSLKATSESVPLGLRYSIFKQVGGSGQEVDTDTTFRSGDRIRLSIQSSDAAYLYIVQQGTSGNWKVLFPSAEIANGNNHVEPAHNYLVPPQHWFAFDEQVGEERLFIMLSRQPAADLEGLIYSLRPSETETPAPASQRENLVIAEDLRPVENKVISQLRSEVTARDLVFEKVDDQTSGQAEKAVYVVNTAGKADSRVVADLTLKHR